ncbi:trypsin 5G1-like [Toxorhynchites rutilus septentrionalis]|uniref:trypsin 5G1-like n=1 Tax=Toxorhynchites rutilus septentrionalis TaxID=329112 RepID=UPI0024786B7B|nr:trypsin 5G1-like [Toxorhynchites rutilus septentrionalis]
MNLVAYLLSVVLLAVSQAFPDRRDPAELIKSQGRIVGGFPVDIKDIPYQVSVVKYGSHTCGGALISSRWVLTAGHCASSSNTPLLGLRVGSTDRNSGGQLLKLKRVVQHPNYNPTIIDYDFALLELQEDVTFNERVGMVSLPEQDEVVEDGAQCRVSGWGSTQNSQESSRYLRAADVPSVNQETCQAAYTYFGEITARMICAGYKQGGKDACQGDSGGPLVSDQKLVGIVSWGFGCARAGYPGVYARVASVRQWVTEVSGI